MDSLTNEYLKWAQENGPTVGDSVWLAYTIATAALQDIARNEEPGQGTRSGQQQADVAREALERIGFISVAPTLPEQVKENARQ